MHVKGIKIERISRIIYFVIGKDTNKIYVDSNFSLQVMFVCDVHVGNFLFEGKSFNSDSLT